MAKYRKLSTKELEGLNDHFVKFLVVNGVTPEQWEGIKSSKPLEAEKVIELFSDAVFESSMRQAKYLIHKGEFHVYCFKCDDEEFHLAAIDLPKDGNITVEQLMSGNEFTDESAEGVKIYGTSKKYSKEREVEMFEMTEKGCLIADGKLYDIIRKNIQKT